jgi:hypothetical protein
MHHDILLAGSLSAILIIFHYVCPFIKYIPHYSRKHFTSFAGGVAAAYVFLHMLPGLVESRDHIHELLSRMTVMTPFKDLAVFIIALLGFELLYILERYTFKAVSEKVVHHRHFNLNIATYSLYNFIVTYTMVERVVVGTIYAVLFTLAIGLHFIITDNHFNRYFPKLFKCKAHAILLSAMLLGYICSLLWPVNVYGFAILTAFLSGSVLYNAFSEEIALDRQTSMLSFFIGSAIMASLLGFLLIK